jgi:hypothetical protein
VALAPDFFKIGCPWVSRVEMPRFRSRLSTVIGSTFMCLISKVLIASMGQLN